MLRRRTVQSICLSRDCLSSASSLDPSDGFAVFVDQCAGFDASGGMRAQFRRNGGLGGAVQKALEVVEEVFVVVADEGGGQTRCAGPSGTSDAMGVLLRRVRRKTRGILETSIRQQTTRERVPSFLSLRKNEKEKERERKREKERERKRKREKERSTSMEAGQS